MLDKFLKVKKSSIPFAGKGVFTKIDIKKGTLITELRGPILNNIEYKKLTTDEINYVFCINRNNYLNSYPEEKQFARYINDINGPSKTRKKNNTEWHVDRKRVFIIAATNIKKDSELFIDYGPDYW